MNVAGGFWDGSGSALLGSALSGVLAVGVFYATRWHERKSAREQLAYQAAEEIAHALLDLESALGPQSWETPRGDWRTLWQAADTFGHCAIVRISALSEPALSRAVQEIYNMVYEALRIMRQQASSDSGPVADVDTDAMLFDTIMYLEKVVNALTTWRNQSVAHTPAVPDLPWRTLLEPEPPHMTSTPPQRRRPLRLPWNS